MAGQYEETLVGLFMLKTVDKPNPMSKPQAGAKIEPEAARVAKKAEPEAAAIMILQDVCPHIATHCMITGTGYREICLLCRSTLRVR